MQIRCIKPQPFLSNPSAADIGQCEFRRASTPLSTSRR